ncbi:hypothetical protein ACWDR0_33810, partial [Streptomyces sp. NPDC003691]
MPQISSAGAALTAHPNPVRAPLGLVVRPSSEGAAGPPGPQPVPGNSGKAVPDYSDTACDLLQELVGTTG